MKNVILGLAVIGLITSVSILSCNTPEQKVENAQNKVDQANKDLDTANAQYLADIEKYRKETADKIAANDSSITRFRMRIENEKGEAKEDNETKIAVLEKKNTDMKKRMDDYKAEGKDKWQIFKAEFSRGMDELGESFKDLTSKK